MIQTIIKQGSNKMRKVVFFTAFAAMVLGAVNVNAQKYGKTPEDSSACLINNS